MQIEGQVMTRTGNERMYMTSNKLASMPYDLRVTTLHHRNGRIISYTKFGVNQTNRILQENKSW
jgi:hypothetical protein